MCPWMVLSLSLSSCVTLPAWPASVVGSAAGRRWRRHRSAPGILNPRGKWPSCLTQYPQIREHFSREGSRVFITASQAGSTPPPHRTRERERETRSAAPIDVKSWKGDLLIKRYVYVYFRISQANTLPRVERWWWCREGWCSRDCGGVK